MNNCKFICDKVENNKKEGIIPRGLDLETKDRIGNKHIIVVGMNPGKIQKNEKEYQDALKNANYENYEQVFEKEVLYAESYFKRTRKILEILGFDGVILWTEIVKCQSEKKGNLPPLTIRTCVHSFLKNEVDLINCPILTLGEQAYNTCLLIFPERKIIGVPHPSGTNRGFPKFMKELEENKEGIVKRINQLKENEAIHLKDIIYN